MKISHRMDLRRLALSVCVTAATAAGWREVRRQLVARFDGQSITQIPLGTWWVIQLEAWAADNA